MSMYYYNRVPERSLEPPEPRNDGVWTCEECGELIPGEALCYEVAGKHYCEFCMDSFSTYAPSVEDMDPRNEREYREDR